MAARPIEMDLAVLHDGGEVDLLGQEARRYLLALVQIREQLEDGRANPVERLNQAQRIVNKVLEDR